MRVLFLSSLTMYFFSCVTEIEETFELVMMVEHFEESIVFLKQLLCWEYDDLVYLKLNAHKKGEKSTLSPEAQEKLRKWLKPDQMLYDHFKALFEKKIEAFGREKMRDELTQLAQAIERFKSRCSIRQSSKMSKIRVKSSDEICQDLGMIHLHRKKGSERTQLFASDFMQAQFFE